MRTEKEIKAENEFLTKEEFKDIISNFDDLNKWQEEKIKRLEEENEELKKYQYEQEYIDKEIEIAQENLKIKEDETRHYLEEAYKYKQALEEVKKIAKLIKDDDDKPACVYDEGCILNGGAGFDNHCNMTCPYVLAKIIDDKINEVLK